MKLLKDIIKKKNNIIKAKIIKISTKNTIKVIIKYNINNKKYKKKYNKKKKLAIHCECTYINKNDNILIKSLKKFSKRKTFKFIKII